MEGLVSCAIEVRHSGLNKYRIVRGATNYEVDQKADALRAQWDNEWKRRLAVEQRRQEREQQLQYSWNSKERAAERTAAAEQVLGSLATILVDGIRNSTPFSWDQLKDPRTFPEPRPTKPTQEEAPAAPIQTAARYQPKNGLLEFLSRSRRMAAAEAAKKLYSEDQERWAAEVAEINRKSALREKEYERSLSEWDLDRQEFENSLQRQHASVDERAAAAAAGKEGAVAELMSHAVDNLVFPECINVNHELDYDAASKCCVIDFNLPKPDDLPTLKEVRFVQSRSEFTEKHISDAERGRLYDSVLYQIALRVIVAAFAADANGYVQRVTFNGWVDYVDKASGMDERSCVLTVAANRSDIDRIDFERVDPKQCFRALKGVAASKLIGLAPVAPLQRPRIVDSRFIESRDVASGIDLGTNIAAMDWQEFEQLVRQLFERVFSTPGSEVRVTQASRDGGVDAIVFDPDPIKGGKIVIQAKRYTNTVGVGAVRDLYGTVLNEGASKGILVTTSTYGPDAHKFAAGKPLTLLDGGNLLSLLEGIGVKARIDLREAKALLSESEQSVIRR
ncbi:restriction endonuclease [Phenylobacterium sp.]|uniref:restriction endonuclease n=1 Tax=Phenylobacterium sp. TaxID=1871053 RepID=UPI0026340E37|nr:restriction endonuclease [Phenylobacterium sp.]